MNGEELKKAAKHELIENSIVALEETVNKLNEFSRRISGDKELGKEPVTESKKIVPCLLLVLNDIPGRIDNLNKKILGIIEMMKSNLF